jgi:hypothetical protein
MIITSLSKVALLRQAMEKEGKLAAVGPIKHRVYGLPFGGNPRGEPFLPSFVS